MFSECTTHYTDPTRSVSTFSVVFVTEVSTAAVLQLFSTSTSSVYVSLSLSNQGVYGCPFHVFSKVSVPTRISTDPGHGTRILGCFYSYFRMSWNIEAFSLCVLLLPNLRVVPHGTKGTGPKFVTRPVYLRSQLRNNTNTVLL